MRRQPVTLSSRDQATIARLLGELRSHHESLIDGETVHGELKPSAMMIPHLRKARRDWNLAEGFVKRFSA